MSDRLIDMLLTEWAKHRAEGIRKGFDQRHEWGPGAPEWAHRECDKCVGMFVCMVILFVIVFL